MVVGQSSGWEYEAAGHRCLGHRCLGRGTGAWGVVLLGFTACSTAMSAGDQVCTIWGAQHAKWASHRSGVVAQGACA